MKLDYRKKYPNLSQLFGGYLNQSWKEIYIWEGRKPAYQPVIRNFKTDVLGENIDKTIVQLKDIMKIGNDMNEEDFSDFLYEELSLGYYPLGDNLTDQEWIEDVLKILEEPMEETLKHWIPKGI
jgi:hypothetical protein